MSINKTPVEVLGFTAYLQHNNYSPATIDRYTRHVASLEAWCSLEVINCQKKDILTYLNYLKTKKKLSVNSRNNALIALRHYFDYLLQENQVATNPTHLIKLRGLNKRTLIHIYNLEELEQLADAYYQLEVRRTQENLQQGKGGYLQQRAYYAKLRNYAVLQLFIYQGLHTREVLQLKTDDLQLQKATIHIAKGSTRGNARTLPLNAMQIGTLMQYLHEVRPELQTANTDNTLFLPIPKKHPKANKQPELCFKGLNRQLERFDRNYTSLVQLRSSVITYWISTQGLRKAQYLAGHKSISSTESYIPNLIEDLAEDITKFNPF